MNTFTPQEIIENKHSSWQEAELAKTVIYLLEKIYDLQLEIRELKNKI